MYIHSEQYVTAGAPIGEAKSALIMLHGRGSTAQNILGLATALKNLDQFALFAPQATQNSWYPYSFMAPDEQNQPALNSALDTIDKVVNRILDGGIPADKIYFLGFSQGACLTLEYIARNPKKYGGAVAFTGGLVGEHLNRDHYKGDFDQTPVLITTGNPDVHVPLTRVEKSVKVLKELNADVQLKIYPGGSHTISQEEITLANKHIFA
ncbi:phospholipase/carboxylesterase [Arcticibacter svalbardensis MN12-7]|uniref:Phospholipase/carboxylesterase n=1 Tax=Arcticibacter svalbardensis MN12-7 TaxID=1150600 RepID=R9GWC8_9SPHI|nr:dienelactone hydrolase family protein [Arcticibacter svalbardensis]EOR95835.1 phospholipase/carboxylesterase [Arcticibacter svalbardensis MN12-7]